MRKTMFRTLLAVAGLMLATEVANAATLYVTEYANGLSQVGSTQPQVPPTPALATQTVALSGTTAPSAAFGTKTKVVALICDEGCSIAWGDATGSTPTATALNTLLQQGVTYLFGVVPGQKVAAIANSAGDTGGGSGGGGGTSSNFGSAFPAAGTAAGFNDGTNMQGARVFDGDTGGGFEYDVGTLLRVPASGGSVAASFGDVNNATSVTGFLDDVPTARYNATLPTLTDTRYNALQVGLRGSLHMELWGSDSTTAIGNFTAGADASTNTKSGLFVYNYPFLFNGTTWDRAPGTAAGGGFVQGSIASAAADSGNPVKIGGVVLATPTSVVDGNRQNVITDSFGGAWVALKSAGSAAGIIGKVTNADGVAVSGALTSLSVVNTNLLYNGTTYDRLRSDGVTGSLAAGGDTASAAADAGNPMKVGGVYLSAGIAFTTGQRANLLLGQYGQTVVGTLVTPADGTSNLATNLTGISSGSSNFTATQSMPMLYNGSTWDRLRSGGVTGMAGVALQASPSGGYSFIDVNTAATTVVKSGAGTLHLVNVGKKGTVASTLTLYDNTAGSGTVIGLIDSLNLDGVFQYDIAFATGLTIVSTGTVAPDFTVSYK